MPFFRRKARDGDVDRTILIYLETILKEIRQMAVSQDQLTTDVNTLQTTLNTGLSDMEAEIAALKAAVAAGQTPDFTALDTIVSNMTTQVKSADPGAQTPTPTPTPAPAA